MTFGVICAYVREPINPTTKEDVTCGKYFETSKWRYMVWCTELNDNCQRAEARIIRQKLFCTMHRKNWMRISLVFKTADACIVVPDKPIKIDPVARRIVINELRCKSHVWFYRQFGHASHDKNDWICMEAQGTSTTTNNLCNSTRLQLIASNRSHQYMCAMMLSIVLGCVVNQFYVDFTHIQTKL